MPNIVLVDFLVVALTFLAFSSLYSRGKQKKLPFPPGPKRLPVIGNLLDMPIDAQWTTYKRWGKLYSTPFLRDLGVPLTYAPFLMQTQTCCM